MKSIIVEHIGENHREYELFMNEIPENPEEYFNETIVGGFENWEWTGPGTATRLDESGKYNEFVQVVDWI